MFSKKLIILLLIVLLLVPIRSYADDISSDDSFTPDFISEIFQASTSPSNDPTTYSKHIIAIDRKTLSVLFEKNGYKVTAMASTTKIMTAIIALENSSMTDIITVSKKSAITNGSTVGLHENEKVSMHDLIYGLMLLSRK